MEKYKLINDETEKLFQYLMKRIKPEKEFLDKSVKLFEEYENKWKDTKYWRYAGAECSAKLQALHREWDASREGNHQS